MGNNLEKFRAPFTVQEAVDAAELRLEHTLDLIEWLEVTVLTPMPDNCRVALFITCKTVDPGSVIEPTLLDFSPEYLQISFSDLQSIATGGSKPVHNFSGAVNSNNHKTTSKEQFSLKLKELGRKNPGNPIWGLPGFLFKTWFKLVSDNIYQHRVFMVPPISPDEIKTVTIDKCTVFLYAPDFLSLLDFIEAHRRPTILQNTTTNLDIINSAAEKFKSEIINLIETGDYNYKSLSDSKIAYYLKINLKGGGKRTHELCVRILVDDYAISPEPKIENMLKIEYPRYYSQRLILLNEIVKKAYQSHKPFSKAAKEEIQKSLKDKEFKDTLFTHLECLF